MDGPGNKLKMVVILCRNEIKWKNYELWRKRKRVTWVFPDGEILKNSETKLTLLACSGGREVRENNGQYDEKYDNLQEDGIIST